ncbi:Interleukin-15 [Dissostichus eleginoides]|uniref:Interleukin n=1 Tax=Dissostichus eleginoides TaxID=100907 RepID=A0AAD9FJ31_DISEL|nr:Interleukin-15 [Dissostichus eleginoides]
MLRGGVFLVSVSLCLVCLIAAPLLARNCSRDLLTGVETLLKKAKELKSLECELYTPTVDHYKNCSQSTMKCLLNEINVLFLEWEAADLSDISELKGLMVDILESMEYNSVDVTTPGTDCLKCESLNVKNAETFMAGLQSILQSMCSSNISPRV